VRPAVRALWTALVLSLAPVVAAAQASGMLLTEGIKAYRDLHFAAAGELLQRALGGTGSRALSPAERLQALMFLGASREFREGRNGAVAPFRTLVLTDPRFRPDSLVFPPRVTQVFAEVLGTTKAVALLAPSQSRFAAGTESFTVRAYASSRQDIDARVALSDGVPIATLFQGTITDSLVLSWNGQDSAGAVARPGRYQLVVVSLLGPDQILRSVRLPLDLRVAALDTTPWPRRPDRFASGWDPRFLLPGAVLGAGLAVPALLGQGSARGPRIAVGLTLATIGIVGGRAGGGTTTGLTRAQWERRVAAVQQENARRRGRDVILIRAGAPERSEGAER
jgi:hypothetical protein